MPRLPHTSPPTRAVLASLLRTYPAHTYGYDLSRATELKSGTLYPILQRLHEQGYLEAGWEPSPHAGKPPRHIYRLTEEGLRLARERQAEGRSRKLKGALT
ncbi:transcriptional regulator, PadR family [Deinococcus reticulitermitis]|uniref:Transcriptional regulator, PadR family n=1 Tax=Deinococcus reticulitermitis TaxID=856736 RepID=A0A1H6U7T5_9DEIO|nr:PadR family transcriptional regulator [Deinococcus reticulitermitis]SEI84370.1 transcriptional regulator, PadR family [Deinococcus reticulitermitis]